jgi:drug/metabolite transporter (DMT)-like permease
MKKTSWAHVGLLLVNLIYGANHTIARDVMPGFVQPFGFIVLRVWGAGILFLIVHALWIKEKIRKSDIPRLLFCALFGIAINQLLFFKGLSLSTPIHSAIIVTTNPIAVMVFASLLIKEKVTFRKVSGIVLGFLGALTLILFGKEITQGTNTFLGDIYIFLNAISYSIFIVIVKPLMMRYHPITVTKWIFTFGMVMVLPFGFQEALSIAWSDMPIQIVIDILYVVICSTFLGYLLNTLALKVLNASTVSIYIYIQPVLAVVIAIGFGRDKLTVISILASALIFAGVYLVSRPSSLEVSTKNPNP